MSSALESVRAKQDIAQIRRNKKLSLAKSMTADGAVSLAQGKERDEQTIITSFFEKGKVKALHATLGNNWVSHGKVASGVTKEGLEHS